SLVLGVLATFALRYSGFLNAPIMIAIALTTTAIGTLLPILRDAGEIDTRFGKIVLAAGAVGGMGPVGAVSRLPGREHSRWEEMTLLFAFAGITGVAAMAAWRVRLAPVIRLLERTLHASSQLPVRVCILLLIGLVVLADDFGLDVILGAFAAGMVVRLGSTG